MQARVPIVFITGHGDIPMAVEAMKRGRQLEGRAPQDMWKVMTELTEEIDPEDDGQRRIRWTLEMMNGAELGSGEQVMSALQSIDEVAYVRFASVYRQFRDINEFMSELKEILAKGAEQ